MAFRNQNALVLGVLLTFFLPANLEPAVCPPCQEQGRTDKRLPASAQKAAERIDINRASVEEFAKLPGIGPELARRIVAFREKHGPFRRVEDLLAIRGIGRKKWRAIRPYLRLESEAEKREAGGQKSE